MKIVRDILLCSLLAALTGLAVCAMQCVRAASATVAAVPGELRATREMVLCQIESARKDLLARSERQAAGLRQDLGAEAEKIRETADRRFGDSLERVDKAFDTVEELRGDAQPVLKEAQGTLQEANRTVADLHPQLLGLVAASKVTAGETAQTMRSLRDAVPNFIAQGNAIAGNVNSATEEFSGVATNLNRLTKPKWYDRLLGYGLNGAVIYRDLNPATNLTVTGLRFLISH